MSRHKHDFLLGKRLGDDLSSVYRDLLQVEDLFRRAEAALRTRPIYHSSDAAIRGHVFCSFLALVLQKDLHPPAAADAADAVMQFGWRSEKLDPDQLALALEDLAQAVAEGIHPARAAAEAG